MRIEWGSFAGDVWEGPATWAQNARWDMIQRHDTTGWNNNAVSVWPVPPGDGLPGVLARIERAVNRYEGIRTQVVGGADGPVQQMYGDGEYPVEIVEAGPCHDAAEAELTGRMRAMDLFAEGRVPFAFAVITEYGVPRSLMICLSHLAMDASTIRLLLDDRFVTAADVPVHPRDLAALQREPAYQRRSERSVAFWRAELSKVDLPFTVPVDPPASGTAAAWVTGVAAGRRLTELTERSGLNASAVVLGVAALAVESVNRHGTVCLQTKTSNRHLPGLADYFGVLVQLSPLVVEVDRGLSFGELVGLIQQRSMKCYRNALWSPEGLYAGLRADGLEPDDVLGATYTFNDLRGPSPRVVAPEPDPGQDYALREMSGWPFQLGRCAIAVGGGPHALTMAARVDTAYLPATTAPRIALAMDAVLRAAHARGAEGRVADLIDGLIDVAEPTSQLTR